MLMAVAGCQLAHFPGCCGVRHMDVSPRQAVLSVLPFDHYIVDCQFAWLMLPWPINTVDCGQAPFH